MHNMKIPKVVVRNINNLLYFREEVTKHLVKLIDNCGKTISVITNDGIKHNIL